jgi:epoxyqueuosine reductase
MVMTSDRSAQIIQRAKELGATMAGIASIELLKKSPSHKIRDKIDAEAVKADSSLDLADVLEIRWSQEVKSALVIAVSHPQDKPELDWWDTKGSPGNRTLIRINRELANWIEQEFGFKTHKMPYSVRTGGIYLKDLAVLSGLGCIGRNNLLVTRELGPRVRLRAMLLEDELTPTGPIAFDPCEDCDEYCRKACPQNALDEIVFSSGEQRTGSLPGRDGSFSRTRCLIQMDKDNEDSEIDYSKMVQFAWDTEEIPQAERCARYCRQCELACPVGN